MISVILALNVALDAALMEGVLTSRTAIRNVKPILSVVRLEVIVVVVRVFVPKMLYAWGIKKQATTVIMIKNAKVECVMIRHMCVKN
jgi:hypothetical protein